MKGALRRVFKEVYMSALSLCCRLLGLKKKNLPSDIKTIGILFLPKLGIGDLVMLSPVIQNIQKQFPDAHVTLLTWIPSIVSFDGVHVEKYDASKKNTYQFDLVVSPALNLRHFRFIFQSKFWVGYFARNSVQGNIRFAQYTFRPRKDHYLSQGIELLRALKWNSEYAYPSIATERPDVFASLDLEGKKYLVLSIFSKWLDRQWPMEKFAAVVRETIDVGGFDKVVLIGDSSEHDKAAAERFVGLLQLPEGVIANATGMTSLSESAYLIEKSALFVGLDSGPSHLAYGLAPRSVVLFVTVDPRLRVPKMAEGRRIIAVYPDPPPVNSLFTGHGPVPTRVVKEYVDSISVQQVMKGIRHILTP